MAGLVSVVVDVFSLGVVVRNVQHLRGRLGDEYEHILISVIKSDMERHSLILGVFNNKAVSDAYKAGFLLALFKDCTPANCPSKQCHNMRKDGNACAGFAPCDKPSGEPKNNSCNCNGKAKGQVKADTGKFSGLVSSILNKWRKGLDE